MNNNENENENENENQSETINTTLDQETNTSSNVKVIKTNSEGKEIETEPSEGKSTGNATNNDNGAAILNNLGTGNNAVNRNKNRLGNVGTRVNNKGVGNNKGLGRNNKLTIKNTNMYNEPPELRNTGGNNTTPNNNITKVESFSNETNTNNNKNSDLLKSLNKLCMNLLNHQIVLKLFHFQTTTYGAHKASDAYLEKYASNMDRFLEVVQGIYGKFTLKQYGLGGSSHTNENIGKHLNGMITYFKDNINDILGDHTELINIRDELLSEIEQLKYLLTFQ